MTTSHNPHNLTPREKQCAVLYASGKWPKEIGVELCISANTVYELLRRAKLKLGAFTQKEMEKKLTKKRGTK